MASLRDMLKGIKDEPAALPLVGERVEEIISRYSTPGILPQFREDVLAMIASVLDLAENMSEKTYRLDEVFTDIANIQHHISTMMKHGILSRPRVVGFGLLNNQSGLLLPAFFYTFEEATNQLRILKDNGVVSPISVVPAECVTSSILQPMEAKKAKLSSPAQSPGSITHLSPTVSVQPIPQPAPAPAPAKPAPDKPLPTGATEAQLADLAKKNEPKP